jgi:hypothetical protein
MYNSVIQVNHFYNLLFQINQTFSSYNHKLNLHGHIKCFPRFLFKAYIKYKKFNTIH